MDEQFKDKMVERSTGALKADLGKNKLNLVSPAFENAVGDVLTYGSIKYKDYNWSKGFQWGDLLGSTKRHLNAWSLGEDVDPETGISHLAHCACNLMFLYEHQRLGLGEDTRYGKMVKPNDEV